MPLFLSSRERRLWLATVAAVVAAFATLGIASRLSAQLNDAGLLGSGLFSAGLLLVLAAVTTQGLRIRPRGWELIATLGIAAAYILAFARTAIPTERSHLIEYGVVAILIYEAMLERRATGGAVRAPAIVAIGVASFAGTLDELAQLAIPDRVFDPRDILFNILAAAMAVSSSAVLSWARRRAS